MVGTGVFVLVAAGTGVFVGSAVVVVTGVGEGVSGEGVSVVVTTGVGETVVPDVGPAVIVGSFVISGVGDG